MRLFEGLVIVLAIAAYVIFKKNIAKEGITTEDIKDEYDYIVVGGGSAGAVVASRLSEDEHAHVLLLEAGRSYEDITAIHVPAMQFTLLYTDIDWQYYSEPQDHALFGLNNRQMFMPRGRVLGGTSTINSMQYTRGSSFDFDEWERAGCTGWSYKDVLPYFKKSEDIQIDNLKLSEYHGQGGPISIVENTGSLLSEYYLNAGQEIGFGIQDYNGEYLEGFSNIQHTIKKGERCSTGLVYLDKLGKRNNLDIAVRSYVTKIVVEGKRATGVNYIKNGRKTLVNARKEVIVSAGAINTPQLLMLSGIGPKKHLAALGIEVIADLPVGEDFQDHLALPLPVKISKPYSLTTDTMTSWRSILEYKLFGTGPLSFSTLDCSAFLHFDKSKRKTTYPDVQWIFFSKLLWKENNAFNYKDEVASSLLADDPNVHGFITIIGPTHLKSRGTLKLRSVDPFEHPIIDPKYLNDKGDIDTFIAAIRQWESFIESPTMKSLDVDISLINIPFCLMHEFRSDEFWECYIRHVVITGYHHASTCKMGGLDDTAAVLDPELKVKGIQGLRVVDASVFPNITSGNTNAPVIMIAEKASDMICGIKTV